MRGKGVFPIVASPHTWHNKFNINKRLLYEERVYNWRHESHLKYNTYVCSWGYSLCLPWLNLAACDLGYSKWDSSLMLTLDFSERGVGTRLMRLYFPVLRPLLPESTTPFDYYGRYGHHYSKYPNYFPQCHPPRTSAWSTASGCRHSDAVNFICTNLCTI